MACLFVNPRSSSRKRSKDRRSGTTQSYTKECHALILRHPFQLLAHMHLQSQIPWAVASGSSHHTSRHCSVCFLEASMSFRSKLPLLLRAITRYGICLTRYLSKASCSPTIRLASPGAGYPRSCRCVLHRAGEISSGACHGKKVFTMHTWRSYSSFRKCHN